VLCGWCGCGVCWKQADEAAEKAQLAEIIAELEAFDTTVGGPGAGMKGRHGSSDYDCIGPRLGIGSLKCSQGMSACACTV
jgi:hypothetical protein